MLAQSSETLRSEREAGAAMRDELRAQLGTADWDRQRAEAELQEERRIWNEKLAATQPYIATMREQYLLAAAERDAIVKELTAQRERSEESARVIEQTRAEFAVALDEEHRTAMELLDRAWRYVQTYPAHSRLVVAHRAACHVPSRRHDSAARAPRRAGGRRRDGIRNAHRGPARRVDRAPPRARKSTHTTTSRPSSRTPLATISTRAPSCATANRDRPIGTVKLGNETVVVCDDGSPWRKGDLGWRQVTPVPGTPVQSRARGSSEPDAPPRPVTPPPPP